MVEGYGLMLPIAQQSSAAIVAARPSEPQPRRQATEQQLARRSSRRTVSTGLTGSGWRIKHGASATTNSTRWCPLLDRRAPTLVDESERPDPETLLERPDAVHQLAGYLIQRLADSVRVVRHGEQVNIQLQFQD